MKPARDLEADVFHLIFLDRNTRLLIQDFDHRLVHPGPGQVLDTVAASGSLGGISMLMVFH